MAVATQQPAGGRAEPAGTNDATDVFVEELVAGHGRWHGPWVAS